jgi:nickel/cobalt exporter
MTEFSELLRQGTTHGWLFVPSAIVLGALHGLEPGHSKTMMAAFIIAVRGTVLQAALLGVAAALSHSMVVWAVAAAGLYFGAQWNGEATEGWFQLVAAVMIVALAAWMAWRTWRDQHHPHDHHHHDDARTIDTGDAVLMLSIFEDGVPPRFRITAASGALPGPDAVRLDTLRPDGSQQPFSFAAGAGCLESREEVPEPHAFRARLSLPGRTGALETAFEEHDHAGIDLGEGDDAHARAHAADIRTRFANRSVTTWQIVLFGLTGGLIPCPASIAVLLVCMQLREFSLGFALVLCFSIGLALTLVSTGVLAALSLRHIERRFTGFGRFARHAPYASAVLIVIVGLYTGWLGLRAI